MVIAKKLRKNSGVMVVSPSRSLSFVPESVIDIAKNNIESIYGLKVLFSKNSYALNKWDSSSVEERVEDLESAFEDNSINCILSSIGGYNTNQLLEHINWDLIKRNPKILCGYSDITVLLNAFYAKTKIISYYGPNFSTFGQKYLDSFTKEFFKKCLFYSEEFNIKPSQKYSEDKWYIDQEDRKNLKNPGLTVIKEGESEGILLGGDLSTFNLLRGTKYMPDLTDSVLLIEDRNIAQIFDRDLEALISTSGFEKVKGILIGRFESKTDITESTLKEIIKSKKYIKDIPVVFGLDFGHTDPKLTLPIGGKISLSVKENNCLIKVLNH